MVKLWRKVVVKPIKTGLIEIAVNLLQSVQSLEQEEEIVLLERYLLLRIISSFIDLSTDYSNIYYVDHSQFKPKGIYSEFRAKALSAAFHFSRIPPANIQENIRLAGRLFPKCTSYPIVKIYILSIQENLREYHNNQILKISSNSWEKPQFLNSPIEIMLLQQNHSKSLIYSYLSSISNCVVNEYNQTVRDLTTLEDETSLNDELIQYISKKLFNLNSS